MSSTALISHRRDVERAILGAMLWNQASIDFASQRLSPGMFQSPQSQELFRTACQMHLSGEQVDVLTLKGRLPRKHWDDDTALQSWLLDLHESTPSVTNLKHYVQQLLDLSMRESIGAVVSETVQALDEGLDWGKALEALEAGVVRVSVQAQGFNADDADETRRGLHGMRLLEWFFEDGGVGFPLPWRRLQEAYGGIHKRKLTTVCGYSSDGKSVVLQQIADSALRSGARVWYVSLEMPVEEVLGRWAALREYVSYPALAQRDPSCQDGLSRFDVDNEDLVVTGRSTTPSRVRAIQMRERYDVIVFDHLHRLSSRLDVLEDAVRQFKNIALDLDCSVVLGAQLSRREDTRPEPNLNMIRGTAGIEHESDLVLSVWRERANNRSPDDPLDTGVIRCLKARGGQRGIVSDVVFNPKHMRFKETGAI